VTNLETYEIPDWKLSIRTNDIVPGIVLSTSKNSATVRIATYEAHLTPQDIAWTNKKTPDAILKRGDVALFMVRSMSSDERKIEVTLEQKPKVQGALVAIDPQHGDVEALVGGYDFDESKFDRATQALRQTGSSFKAFVYTAAVDHGLRPNDSVLDAPVNFGGYAPTNYDGRYEGVITIRRAVAQSRNVPAVRTLANLGIDNLIPYLRKFGITSKIDPFLPIALGAADVTLMEMVSAYSTFPNDGVRALPRTILYVTDYDGNVMEEKLTEVRDVIPAETAHIMVDLLQEPVRSGTATKVQELKRPAAGKTGTTNDFTDAWFIGFTPSLVVGVWVGFDEKITLGDKETGGKAALPIWLDMMQQVYKNRPVEQFETAPAEAITAVSKPVIPEHAVAQGSAASRSSQQ